GVEGVLDQRRRCWTRLARARHALSGRHSRGFGGLEESPMNLKESCKRSKARLCGTIACCLLIGPAAVRTTSAQQNVVLQWNSALLRAVRNTRFAPVFSARALAIVHTSMYDSWAEYDSAAVGTRYGAALRRPPRERTLANKQEAVSYAAYRALVDLFPSQQADVFDPLMTSLGFDPDNR